jgi:alkanesulfonate monooxygenase
MGSVDDCLEQLGRHLETGVDRLIFVPYRYESEQVRIVAEEIVPRLRS